MVNTEVVFSKITTIKKSLDRLQQMLDNLDTINDEDSFAIAEHHLRRALEAVFDLGRHIIAKKGWGYPEDYTSVLRILSEHGVITPEYYHKNLGMAGYRNRMVHDYQQISGKELFGIIKDKLPEVREYCTRVMEYLGYPDK